MKEIFQAQVNELYLKSICYNLCVLVKAIFELEIETDFDYYALTINKK